MEKNKGTKKEELGIDVKLSSKKLENDAWANKMLREIGSTMKEPGMVYAGSCVMHYYITGDLVTDNQIAIKQQFVGAKEGEGLSASISPAVAAFSVQNLSLELRKHFEPSYVYKTTNKNDKR